MTKSVQELLNQKRQQTQDKKVSGKNTYRFKNGVTSVRILPGWREDDPTFFHDFGQSFIKDFDGKTIAVVGDRKITYGEDEPLRDAINRAIADAATDGQRKHYKEMLAKPRILVNALVLDDKEIDPTVPQIVEFSETQFDQILEQVQLAGIEGEFLDLTAGFNLKVSKTGVKFDTKYTFAFDRKASAVPDGTMENITDLDAYIRGKFANHDKAMNALKAVTQGLSLDAPETKALSYSGSAPVVDGDFSDATDDAGADAPVAKQTATDAEIEELFADGSGDDNVPF